MKRRFRLTRSTDFKRVRNEGKSYAHPLVVLIAAHTPEMNLQIGVSAGKALGNAVQRNRAKRLLREALRPELPALSPGWKVVLIARRPLSAAPFQEVKTAVQGLLTRAGLFLARSQPEHVR